MTTDLAPITLPIPVTPRVTDASDRVVFEIADSDLIRLPLRELQTISEFFELATQYAQQAGFRYASSWRDEIRRVHVVAYHR